MLVRLVDFFPNILLLSSIVPVVRDRIISLLEILCHKQSGCASLSLNIRARTTGDAKAGLLLGRTRLWGAADLLLHLKPCSSNYLPPFSALTHVFPAQTALEWQANITWLRMRSVLCQHTMNSRSGHTEQVLRWGALINKLAEREWVWIGCYGRLFTTSSVLCLNCTLIKTQIKREETIAKKTNEIISFCLLGSWQMDSDMIFFSSKILGYNLYTGIWESMF